MNRGVSCAELYDVLSAIAVDIDDEGDIVLRSRWAGVDDFVAKPQCGVAHGFLLIERHYIALPSTRWALPPSTHSFSCFERKSQCFRTRSRLCT